MRYSGFIGGHAPFNWEQVLPDALQWTFGRSSAANAAQFLLPRIRHPVEEADGREEIEVATSRGG